jgi:hypothetical protein
MLNARNKGIGGEREFIRIITEELGIAATRNLYQTREGGHDLAFRIPPYKFFVEVKRRSHITDSDIARFWRQAVGNSQDGMPMLATREDRQPWLIRIPGYCVDPDLTCHESHRFAIILHMELFLCWAREQFSKHGAYP